ncbi:MAG: hypothetical protein GYB67_16425 [Chloroflexi bacterium]|nr:hypothetical protein [Chloroflexota bacterium]
MLSAVLKLALLLILLSGGGLALLRAQPNPDAARLALLTPPPGCAVPCWQGIQVGITEADTALRLLENHAWVDRVIAEPDLIIWRWNGTQPALIDGAHDGLLRVNRRGVVTQLRIQTRIAFGSLWPLLPPPSEVTLVRTMSRYSAHQILTYSELGLYLVHSHRCPAGPDDLWTGTVTIGMGTVWLSDSLNGRPFNIYGEPGWWRDLRACRRAAPPR